MFLQYLKVNNLEKIRNHINTRGVPVTPSQLHDDPRRRRNHFISAEVLKIKRWDSKQAERRSITHRLFRNQKSVSVPYDRLIILRELLTGEVFYLISENVERTKLLFTISKVTWQGCRVTLFEPTCDKKMYNLPLVKLHEPLIPIDRSNVQTELTVPLILEDPSDCLKCFFVVADELQFDRLRVERACASSFCDGNHGIDSQCLGLHKDNGANCLAGSLSHLCWSICYYGNRISGIELY